MVPITVRTLILSLSVIAAVAAQPHQSPEAKVQRLVAGSGDANQHPSAKAWLIPATGPAIGDYKVFVAVSGGIRGIGPILVQKRPHPLTLIALQPPVNSDANS